MEKLPSISDVERAEALETVRIMSDVSDYLENLDDEYFKGKEKKIKEQTEWWDDYYSWFQKNVDKLNQMN